MPAPGVVDVVAGVSSADDGATPAIAVSAANSDVARRVVARIGVLVSTSSRATDIMARAASDESYRLFWRFRERRPPEDTEDPSPETGRRRQRTEMTDTTSAPRLRLAVVPVTPLEQNSAILFDDATKIGVVTDPGGDVPRLLDAVSELGVTVEKILLTHGHFDHAGGATDLKAELERRYGRPVPIEGPHRDDAFLLETIPTSSARWGVHGLKACTSDRFLEDGDEVRFADVTLRAIHCPGHSPGSIVYFQPEVRLAIVGDVIFAGSIGRTDLPRGDHAALMRSIHEKLLPLGDDVGFLPGHGPTSTLGAERASNPFLVED
jgi:glyoxylase-like metal-dependent hydrolase (beta-lactamase superfamily II)